MKFKLKNQRWIMTLLLSIVLLNDVFAQQERIIRGNVIDSDNIPLPGVSILVKGTTIGTLTNVDGVFVLNIPTDAKILVFSFVGMKTIEVPIDETSNYNVRMEEETISLQEVVAIGYGTMRKSDLTGAVSQIDPSKNPSKITSNAIELLRNSISGLNLPLSVNAKGSINQADIIIRGQNSIKASNSPLVILDGMIYNEDLANISAHTIERIDVLKDASAAAIYGSRASNGVIIISTKKGKKGEPTIQFSINSGLVTSSFLRPVYSPSGYINMRYNIYKQGNPRLSQPGYYDNPNNLPPGVTKDQWLAYSAATGDEETIWLERLSLNPTEIKNYKEGKTIDWAKELFQTGILQDYSANVSGGDDKAKYFLSTNYTKNEGFKVGDEYSSFRTTLNVESNITRFLTIGVNAHYVNRDESSITTNWSSYSNLSPFGSKYEDDGKTLKLFPHDDPVYTNPFLSKIYDDKYFKASNITSKMYADIKLPLGFNYQINYVNLLDLERSYYSVPTENPSNTTRGSASRQNYYSHYWSLENVINWAKVFGSHNFNVTVMGNIEKNTSWNSLMSNSQFQPSTILGYHNMSLGSNPVISSNDQIFTRNALLGRLNYIYDEKYLLTMAVRRDGYSAFGQQNPYGFFPTVALAWKISDENFFNIDKINFLKLRLSWGANGNSAIGAYDALARMVTTKSLLSNQKGEAYPVSVLLLDRLANKNLQWEKTTASNLGVDFGLFNNKINGSLETYFSKTTNLLIDRTLPKISGFSTIASNLGELRNTGIELTLNTNNITVSKKFNWKTSIIANLNRNKIIHLYGDKDEFGNEVDDIAGRLFIGHGLDEIWDYIPNGVWQIEDKDLAYSYGGYLPGEYRMVDKNNDGLYTEVQGGDWRKGDKDFLGFSKPRFQWSIINDFIFADRLSISFTTYGFHGHKGSFLEQAGNERSNTFDIPYWNEENRSNKWIRTKMLSANPRPMSNYLNLGFIRISDISIRYAVPESLTNHFKLKGLNVGISVKNAFLFTKWPGWDPEQMSGPVPRYYNLSLNIEL